MLYNYFVGALCPVCEGNLIREEDDGEYHLHCLMCARDFPLPKPRNRVRHLPEEKKVGGIV